MTKREPINPSGNHFTVFNSELAKDSDESKLFAMIGNRLVHHFGTDVEGIATLIFRGFAFQFKFKHQGKKVVFGKDFYTEDVPVIISNDDVFNNIMTWLFAYLYQQFGSNPEKTTVFA